MKTVRIVEFDASGIRTGVVDVDPGKTHTVTWVWAWNRTLRFEQDRDTDSAQAILTNVLLRLLSADENWLQTDQKSCEGQRGRCSERVVRLALLNGYPL
jgi:hypothetical protein